MTPVNLAAAIAALEAHPHWLGTAESARELTEAILDAAFDVPPPPRDPNIHPDLFLCYCGAAVYRPLQEGAGFYEPNGERHRCRATPTPNGGTP